jgi:PAS domain S-box-containing protein
MCACLIFDAKKKQRLIMAKRRLPFQVIKSSKLTNLQSDITALLSQIESARNFIKAIEGGNLSVEFERSKDDKRDQALAESLISMRDQMRKIADNELQRNWITEGLAKFIDILRSNNDDLKNLGQQIISQIIKYMGANQGALYILNDAASNDVHLEMIACYAYDRKKHFSKRIELGEGIVGQCVLEKSSVYMTNLPSDYIKITSGLGQALPKNLLVVPLIINDKIYGVVEMASFHMFEAHHKTFIEKLAESIASTIANVRTNEQTKKLLHETQTQAEQVRSQEEEMRQNMEELTATQEEMQRILKDVEKKEAYLNQLLNVSTDSIFTVDRTYKLMSWNKTFAKTLDQFGMSLQKGMNTLDWYPVEERSNQIAIYDRVFNRESFDFTASSKQNGKTLYHLSIYAPLYNEQSEVFEAAVFAKDITEMMTAQNELQAQEEELRQNMEELTATQEEMMKKEIEMTGQLMAINNSMAAIEFTMDGLVINANDKFLELMGYQLEEIKAKHHRTFLDSQNASSESYIKFWKDLNKGIPQNGEFKRVAKNGNEVWISASYTVVMNKENQPLKVIKFALDITDQKIKSLDHEGQINAINNTMASIEFDLNGNIIEANDAFVRTMGYAKNEIIGRHHSMFVDSVAKDTQAYSDFWKNLRSGIAQTGEFKRFGKNGKTVWINASYTPIRDASSKVYKVIKFAQDVTEEKLKSVDYEGQINAIRRSNAVIEFDVTGKILYANDLFINAMGYKDTADIINLHHSIFVSDFEVKSADYKKFWERLERGEFFTGEFQRKKADGQSIWIYGSYNPILDADGKPYKVVKYAQVVNKNAQRVNEKSSISAL